VDLEADLLTTLSRVEVRLDCGAAIELRIDRDVAGELREEEDQTIQCVGAGESADEDLLVLDIVGWCIDRYHRSD